MSMMLPTAGPFRLVPQQTYTYSKFIEAPHTRLGQDFARVETARERLSRRKDLETLMKTWKLKVGFEFHVQMKTKHKMFSSKLLSSNFVLAALCSHDAEPNTMANFVDLALPGMLPVLNEECLDLAIKASL